MQRRCVLTTYAIDMVIVSGPLNIIITKLTITNNTLIQNILNLLLRQGSDSFTH